MERTKRNHLQANDICALIKECSSSGVREFVYGDLHITFSSKATEETPPQAIAGLNQREQTEVIERAIAQAEVETKTNQLDHMLVEDPAEYERLILEGELVDGNSRTESAV